MGIKSLSTNYKGKFVRPTGYRYPLGLSTFFLSTVLTANAATNTTGGSQTIDGANAVHTFSSSPGSGTFTPGFTGDVELLVVAGGGGSGGGGFPTYSLAGAGAGGLIFIAGFPVVSSSPYSVTVGGGGAALSNGSNSTFSTLTALGGGAGRYGPRVQGGSSSGADYQPSHQSPAGTGVGLQPLQPGLSGSSGFGNRGGAGADFPGSRHFGGGGGGAGGDGANAAAGLPGITSSGAGGVGLSYSISGSATFYAGGGGGGIDSPTADTAGAGGNGGGGAGGSLPGSPAGANGTVSRGGGAGGMRSPAGGTGGSGIVIVRYQTAQYSNTSGFTIE